MQPLTYSLNTPSAVQCRHNQEHSNMPRPSLLVFAFSILLLCQTGLSAVLSTSSRWIVDESGRRVKLACVNWVSHLEPMVAEGLGKQPLDVISKSIASMGFNCVRFTWPLFLATDHNLAAVTVRRSFASLGLNESLDAILVNNPSLVDLTLLQAYKAVVANLGENNLMVILDNHISKPGWCCSNSDGNGFFGDEYFDSDLWLSGLTKMATLFNDTANVIGMSLRNELRGPKQNVNDWYKYMQKGAEAVHAANPNVLVILSGLSFDNDLSFLARRQVQLSFTSKLVFELHWYAFSNGNAWESGSPNQICGSISSSVMRKGGFLLSQGWPLFISEFGIDQRGTNTNDNRYLGCILGLAAELDIDWALWTLQGSYYLRQGVIGMEEFYGVLDYDWCRQRNSTFLQRVSTLQSPFQGPGLSEAKPYKVLFHPATGKCIVRNSLLGPLRLGPCEDSEAWDYTEQHALALKGTMMCLRAVGEGERAELGIICGDSASKWELVSDSRMHVSAKLSASSSSSLCLDVEEDGSTIVTSSCRCLGKDQSCDPENQWFRIVDSSRPVGMSKNKSSVMGWLYENLWWN